jgi:hypothetical protein
LFQVAKQETSLLLGAGFAQYLATSNGLTLTGRSCGRAIGPQVPLGERRGGMPVGSPSQQQAWPFVDEAYAGRLVTLNTALMPFGQAAPPFPVEIILREIALRPACKAPTCKASPHRAAMEADRILATGQSLAELGAAVPTLAVRVARRSERGVHRPQVLERPPKLWLHLFDLLPSFVAAPGKRLEVRFRTAPFFAGRLRSRDCRTSHRASARRIPGG